MIRPFKNPNLTWFNFPAVTPTPTRPIEAVQILEGTANNFRDNIDTVCVCCVMRVFRGPFAEAQASIHRDAVGVYLVVVVVVVVVVWFCGWYNSLYGHLLFGFFPFGLHLFYYRFCLFIILFPTPFPPLSLSLSISLSLSLSFFHSFQFSSLVQGSVANFDLFFCRFISFSI